MNSENVEKENNELTMSVTSYQDSIIEMIKEMENPRILKLIYGFTKSGYREEMAGRM